MAEKPHSSSSIMLVVLGVALLLVVAIVPFSGLGKGGKASLADDDTDQRILPVARFEMAKAAPKATGPRDGASVYGAICQACHATGVAGAPKAGDKAAWAPRIGKGPAELVKSVINGKGAMPPKGGAADLSDAEVKAAVEHLLGLSK